MPTADIKVFTALRSEADVVYELLSFAHVEWMQAPPHQELLRWQTFFFIIFVEEVCAAEIEFTANDQVPEFLEVHEPPNDAFLVLRLKLIVIGFDGHLWLRIADGEKEGVDSRKFKVEGKSREKREIGLRND
jgi:hypothetical protein